MIFLDTETCGFHGPTVLIQWARDDGEINLHSVFTEPIQSTLDLIEMFCFEEDGICGFNLAFDWFHLVQTYTTLSLLPPDAYPQDIINDYAIAEKRARTEGYCIKPMKALDLMLHARKGEYQSTMDRSDVRIKRVPTPLAWELVEKLNKRIPLKDVYFARYSDPTRRWQVMDILDDFGDVIPEFKDVVLKFAPSSALKALAQDALNVDTEKIKLFADVELPKSAMPVEYGYAPFALAVGSPDNWNGAWPDYGKIMTHVSRWTYNSIAREYASDDVKYTRMLYHYFGQPEAGDDDSELACMIGAVRWRGFKINVDALNQLKQESLIKVKQVEKKFNFNSSAVCRKYMEQVLGETEKLALRQNGKITTKSVILEDIAKWTQEIVCPTCKGMDEKCIQCNGDGLIKSDLPHPAAERAKEILDARHAKKEVELYDKLLKAGRFHASFKVIGTLSNRMSGTDGFNPQGIKRAETVRSCFPLADGNLVLSGGDFDSFEVSIAEAVYHDPRLREDMMSGKKLHGLVGMELFPPKTYEEIYATKKESTLDKNLYTRAKNCVFAMLYGGEAHTLATRGGIPIDIAERAYQNFLQKYPIWGKKRQEYFDMFCVTGDTWIQTNKGPKQVKNLIETDCIIVVNNNKYNTKGFFKSGYKEVFEIKTEQGYKLEATDTHPLLVNYFQNLKRKEEGINVWKQIKNIQIGEKIHLAPNNLIWEGEGTFEQGYLLGWLFGDGTVYKKHSRLIFYHPDFIMLDFIKNCFKNEPIIRKIEQSNSYYIYSQELDNLISEFGIDKNKIINENIEEASSEFYTGFLSAFFDTDGSAKSSCKEITLSQSDLNRLEAIQRMLMRFGIQSTITKVKEKGKMKIQDRICNIKSAYKLYIGASNVIKFNKKIGFKNPEKSKNVLMAIQNCDKCKLYKEDYLVKVVSIKYKGMKNVYDITVPNIECFSANGILAHNCSMRQPGGIGSKVEWHEPSDFIESMFGFRRYFVLENQICKALFELANDPPKEWTKLKIKVTRRDREQTISGAIRSALFAAAFALQASNMRAAANHVIQSSGATMTKILQRRMWDLQPPGINHWRIQPMNIHDEIMCPVLPVLLPNVKQIVDDFVDEYKEHIPFLKMEWESRLETWADK